MVELPNKVRWIYRDETNDLARITPIVHRNVDFGRPNALKITRLIGAVALVSWFILYNLILQ